MREKERGKERERERERETERERERDTETQRKRERIYTHKKEIDCLYLIRRGGNLRIHISLCRQDITCKIILIRMI